MSWVANVLLLYSVGEEWVETEDEDADDYDLEYVGTSPCLLEIQRWLRENDQLELLNLSEMMGGKERRPFEACFWGAAMNYLDIDAFLGTVKKQAWREPANVQVLIKDQEEERFTLHTLADIE